MAVLVAVYRLGLRHSGARGVESRAGLGIAG
jgi:hypothetical protein